MGKIRLIYEDTDVLLPMPATLQVGRHWSCFAQVKDGRIPQFWLEIRWKGSTWAWRVLNAEEETRGMGAMKSHGWRELPPDPARVPSISLGDVARIEFLSIDPPHTFAQNIQTGEVHAGDALDDLWEDVDGQIYRFGWEEAGQGQNQALNDGDLLVSDGDLYRVFMTASSPPTMMGSMDLATQECEVEIDLDTMTATFESSRGSASASGECVRVLAAYALARRDENRVDGGWLTAQEIYNRWVDLGGNASSKMDRPGFERKAEKPINQAIGPV